MNKYVALLAGLITVFPVLSQTTLNLSEAICIALENNPNIQIAQNNAANAKNEAQIGNAGLLPQFTLSASAVYSEDAGQLPPRDASTTTSTQLQIGYTLFDGFGNIYRFKQLQAGSKLGQAEAQNQIESIILQVADGYYRTAAAYENRQIAQELVRLSQERFNRAQNRAEYGRARTLDVLSARVDLNADSVTLAQADLQWEQSIRSLNLLLFRDINTSISVDTSVIINLQTSLIDLMNQALDNNAGLEAARLQEQQARYQFQAAQTAHLPRLDLSASYGYSQLNPDIDLDFNNPVKTARIGASFSFNLFNGFQTQIKRQNARRNLENQAMLAEQADLSLRRDLTNAYQGFQTSLHVWALARRSLEVALLNFRRAEELYQLGQVTTTQFREAQLNLIKARSQVSTAKYDAKLNEMGIRRLVGDLVAWKKK
ncbi:TolC family protein [bacterium]|nr:TolC family protein [bacterium]